MTYRKRVIPCLLLSGYGLVKTRKFRDPVYIGDPVNAVRIFSEKEADELIVLDIDASCAGREPNFDLISAISGECFMPVAYGGGVRTLSQVRRLIRSGVEKVVVNSVLADSLSIITEAAGVFGSQAIVAGVDVKRRVLGGYTVVVKSGSIATKLELDQHVQRLESAGAGEIFLNSVDRDGTQSGYDLDLVRRVVDIVNIPVVASGGAGTFEHLAEAVRIGGASAAAAGSMFVFHGKRRAVLINYPTGSDFL